MRDNNRPPRLRSFFWPGFVAGFLLLAVLSCGGIAMATGLGRIDLSDLQAGSAAWTPPTLAPTPPATEANSEPSATGAQSPSEGAGMPSFQTGDVARNVTSSQVNIRQSPGYLGKLEGDIVAQMSPGDRVEILGERAVVDNLFWWYVRFITANGVAIDGWVAEATASGVQILGPE